MSTSAKGKKSVSLDEFTEMASKRTRKSSTTTKASPEEKAVSEKFASIQENPFYKIVFAEGDPEAKKEAIAKELAFDLEKSKEENKASLSQFEEFKEWLMNERKEMAQQIIKLTDTDTFAELKSVFDDMNSSLLDFEQQMGPLTEILDAVYKLRSVTGDEGTMFEVFKEIQEDKAEEERLATLREEQESKLGGFEQDVTKLQQDIAVLRQKKSFFGMGGTSKSALEDIARKEVLIANKRDDISALRDEIASTPTASERDSKFAEFSEEKAKLRELLDITSDAHKERQEELVKSAQDFVTTTETRSGSVLEHLRGIDEQIDRLSDSNGGMQSVYAIISDAVKDAEKHNESVRDTLQEKEGVEESNIARMKRERSKIAVEEHSTSLTAAKVDTMGTFADLTAESYRIKSMGDSNAQQINKMRTLHSQGVAGVASRLSTVLTGVSMAALTESSEIASMTLERMNTTTTELSLKESLKNAMGIRDQNDALTKAIGDLESYGKVARTATNITREGLTEMKENLAVLEEQAREVGDAVKDAIAVNADVMNKEGDAPTRDNSPAEKPKGPAARPFDNI